MTYTRRQQGAIRRHWSNYELRFQADGTVEARRGSGKAWGLLYTAADASRHLEAIGLLGSEGKKL